MWRTLSKTQRKYLLIEIMFFLFICYLGAIISDLEYSFYEEHDIWKFTDALEYRAVYGTFNLLYYGTWYWLFLKPFIFRKRTVHILVSIALFILLSHLYDKYVVNFTVSRLPFISGALRRRALNDYERRVIYYIISYTLNRIVFTIIGFTFLVRSLQLDEDMKDLRAQQLASELSYLKAQLQPHFFFNTLNNIYALAMRRSRDTAPALARLADMMRYILYDADKPAVPLRQEIAFIRNYARMEQLRHHEQISITLDVQGEPGDKRISPLLVLPLVENAFKHGIHDETATGSVHVVCCITEHELIVDVTNTKPAISLKAGGVGLANLRKRLDLVYAERYQLSITDHEHTFHALLTVPLV